MRSWDQDCKGGKDESQRGGEDENLSFQAQLDSPGDLEFEVYKKHNKKKKGTDSCRHAREGGQQRIYGYANRILKFVTLSTADIQLSTGDCIAVNR